MNKKGFYDRDGQLSHDFKEWVLGMTSEVKLDMLQTCRDSKSKMYPRLLNLLVGTSEKLGGVPHEEVQLFLEKNR